MPGPKAHATIQVENYIQRPVVKAVLAVPADFTEEQRNATIAAGKAAGLDVLRIISEPTAAALAYGLQQVFETPPHLCKSNVPVFLWFFSLYFGMSGASTPWWKGVVFNRLALEKFSSRFPRRLFRPSFSTCQEPGSLCTTLERGLETLILKP